MGNLFSSAENRTDIQLTEQCMLRLQTERTPQQQEVYEYIPTDQEEWMRKLRCMDEAHSRAYGLSAEAFNKLIHRLQERLKVREECTKHELIKCLRKNVDCSIKCKKLCDEFIDCVDEHRIGRTKCQIEQDLKDNAKVLRKKLIKDCLA